MGPRQWLLFRAHLQSGGDFSSTQLVRLHLEFRFDDVRQHNHRRQIGFLAELHTDHSFWSAMFPVPSWLDPSQYPLKK